MVFTLRIGGVFHVKSSCLLWFDLAVLRRFLAVASNKDTIYILLTNTIDETTN